MKNEYPDYNNEEVSNYVRKKDPREIDQVSRLEELRHYKKPIIKDDNVTINQMTISHHTIIEESTNQDTEIKDEIDNIKDKIDDNDIIILDNEE